MRTLITDHVVLIPLHELRAIVEELVRAEHDPARTQATDALAIWLRLHCTDCGRLIAATERGDGEEYCGLCLPPPPPLDPATCATDDVPF